MRLMRVDSKPCLDLLHRLGLSKFRFRSVHITGSKGKGSVGALLSAVLQHHPFTNPGDGPVGTFSSPHIEKINERVCFNGTPIQDDVFAQSLTAALDARIRPTELSNATWFDVVTACAMDSFHKAGVSRAVVEVGMGGRLDSTNVLRAPVSVITNIFLEHQDILGPTLRDIALEKAGIIAPGAQVILGLAKSHPLADVFLSEAEQQSPKASVSFCPPLPRERLHRTNLRLAREALRAIAKCEGLNVNVHDLLTEKFSQSILATFPARQEPFSVSHGPTGRKVGVILDGAHVIDSVMKVLNESPWPHPVVVVALKHGRDIDGICNVIASRARHVIATSIDKTEFYVPADQTARAVRFAGALVCETVPDPHDAVYRAIHAAVKSNTGVLIIGSLHLAGRVRPMLREMSSFLKDTDRLRTGNMM